MGFSLGGFLGGSSSSSSAPASVYGAQEPYLQDLYGRSQLASYGNTGQNYANQINQGAQTGFQNQAQGGFQTPGLQQVLQDFGGMQNEALGGAIQSGLGQIGRNFQRNIMPGINTGAAMTNTSGGSRQGIAQGLAASDANQQATDFVNNMQSQNWGQQMQNQLGAYGQQGNLQAQQNMAQQGALGQAPQIANLGFGEQYGDLSALSSLIGSPAVLGGGSSSSQQGGVGGSLSGGAEAGALGYLAFSDRRLKENIHKVGTTDGGTNLYKYNYKWSPQIHIGVMADEVDESITVDINGFKAVDYSRVK